MSERAATHWATVVSPTVEAVVNPFAAACAEGFVPDTVSLLQNPALAGAGERARELCAAVGAAHGNDAVEFTTTELEGDRAFRAIVAFYRDAIERARDAGATVAVNVTPGRKYMSAIAFQAGVQFGADHIYYLYLDSQEFYGRVYPDIPRTGVDLVDFAEVLG